MGALWRWLLRFSASLVICLILESGVPTVVDASSFALNFTADGQSAIVPDSNSLDITGPLTIEAWVKPASGILSRGYSSIVSKQMSGTGYMLATNIEGPQHRFKSEVHGDQVTSASQPVIGVWQHVAAVWDGQLKIYVNGQFDGILITLAPLANAFPLWIGSSPFGDDTNWRGAIDDVRIWSVARTEAEIQHDMLYSLNGNEAGLRAYWNFDEGSGQTFADLTGQNPGFLGLSTLPDSSDPSWVDGVQLLPAPEPSSLILTIFGSVGVAFLKFRRPRRS